MSGAAKSLIPSYLEPDQIELQVTHISASKVIDISSIHGDPAFILDVLAVELVNPNLRRALIVMPGAEDPRVEADADLVAESQQLAAYLAAFSV